MLKSGFWISTLASAMPAVHEVHVLLQPDVSPLRQGGSGDDETRHGNKHAEHEPEMTSMHLLPPFGRRAKSPHSHSFATAVRWSQLAGLGGRCGHPGQARFLLKV